jgi:ABC-type transport system involved in cytochrome bd biosynthesis fused ATPase/permease subunit
LRTATEYANKLIRARVAAARVCRVLALTPDHLDPVDAAPLPPAGAELADARTGLRVPSGLVTAVVSDQPDEAAALADRLGLCAPEADDDVTLGGVPLTAMRREDVRRRIVVSDTGATLFSGRLGDVLDATGGREHAVAAALATASTADILEALADGLDSQVAEKGRTFSGGQRQRLVLARALTADPEILVLVEPTSAVDAHTEARIAARVAAVRRGRTTVVSTVSPLWLHHADRVVLVEDGKASVSGSHEELLTDSAAYRRVVGRSMDAPVEEVSSHEHSGV